MVPVQAPKARSVAVVVALVAGLCAAAGCSDTGMADQIRSPHRASLDAVSGAAAGGAAPVDDASSDAAPAPTLPLVPTTTTIPADPPVDPPRPVDDPDGPPGRNSVMVIGDSVFIGTAGAIPAALPDWVVTYDAEANRRLAQAIDLIVDRRDEVGGAVVIHLGNNYIPGERGEFAGQIDTMMLQLWFVPQVVWVTVPEVNTGRAEINEDIRAAAERWPNMVVVDWAPEIAANPDWSWDGLHLTPAGREAMAERLADALGTPGRG